MGLDVVLNQIKRWEFRIRQRKVRQICPETPSGTSERKLHLWPCPTKTGKGEGKDEQEDEEEDEQEEEYNKSK